MRIITISFSEPPKDDAEGDTKPEEPTPEPEEPAKPLRPKIPGAMGFGGNIMAQLKEKQEKRLSMVSSMHNHEKF